jgi:MoxR-like ATPase
MQIPEAAQQSRRLLDVLQQAVIGKETVLQHILLGIYSGGNVLIEDVPGVAKTLMARLIAQVTGMDFKRIQFTPDLLPGDITGGLIYNQKTSDFEFRPGPLFANLVLADEVNRAPPKTQAALLEVMQERQVTIEGHTYPMQAPFVVVATQNPIELEGTYPLPEAQLDRFMLRVRVGYPEPEEERRILAQRGDRQRDQIDLPTAISAEQLLQLQGDRNLYCEPHGGNPRPPARAGGGVAARLARPLSASAGLRHGAGARFCLARRCQRHGRPRPGASIVAQAGVVGARRAGGRRGARYPQSY